MATVQNPREIVIDTIPLRDHSEILSRLQERREIRQSMYQASSETRCHKIGLKSVLKYLIVCLLVTGAVIAYALTQLKQDSTLESLVTNTATAEKQTEDTGYNIELEINSEHSYQHCKGFQLKQAFPDIDYALFGYNILKGFPLAIGHDPGFTYPIFFADYSSGRLSADCRYFVPNGIVVAPDIACLVSLSSETVQTKYEFSKSFGIYTTIEGEYSGASKGNKVLEKLQPILQQVMGNGSGQGKEKKPGTLGSSWGISFSASVGYRQTSSKLSSGQSVYVYSTAKCKYYFSKLVRGMAPKFDTAFLKAIYKLDKVGVDTESYFDFFDTYGTHFPIELSFGARYTFEHRMSSKYYESMRERGIDVNVLASYTGKISLAGNLSVSHEQSKMSADFSENVQTKIIPVGASPPADGNALTWSSKIQSNPIPIDYKLISIENLFTDEYMKHLNINYNKIRGIILTMKLQYCSYLQDAGKVESCENLGAGIVLDNTKLLGHYSEVAVTSVSGCIDQCLQDRQCEAITYCISCVSKDLGYKKCYLVTGKNNTPSALHTQEPNTVWQSNIFPEKMNTQMELNHVKATGIERVFANEEDRSADLSRCKELCVIDVYCSAYTFTYSRPTDSRCKMYTGKQITGLQADGDSVTVFIPSHRNISA